MLEEIGAQLYEWQENDHREDVYTILDSPT